MFLVEKQYREIIFYKAKIHLISEASKTYLSFLWWAVDPVISMAIYYLVFGIIFQRGTEDFIPFLLIGLITWQWFSNIISHCANSVNNNLSLISQVGFPKIILPGINIVMDTFKFLIVFSLLLLYLWAYGFPPNQHYTALPLVLFTHHILNCCLGNLTALIVPFFPDIQIILSNILRIGMYGSGILYSIESLPASIQPYFYWNPFAQLIDAYRDILMYNSWPDFTLLTWMLSATLAGLIFTTLIFKKLDPYLPRVLLQR